MVENPVHWYAILLKKGIFRSFSNFYNIMKKRKKNKKKSAIASPYAVWHGRSGIKIRVSETLSINLL
jgi:hypothetical protein